MISLLAMIEAGMGITTLPRLAFPAEPGALRFIPLAAPSPAATSAWCAWPIARCR